MYSIVLAMALSNGAALPAWDEGWEKPGAVTHQLYRHRRGHGCCGCCGGGCYGGSGGCYGGYGSCYGGYGGCWGGGYASGGCWGGGYASGGGYGSYSGGVGYGAYPAYGNPSYYGATPTDMSGLYGPAATPGTTGPGTYSPGAATPGDRPSGLDRRPTNPGTGAPGGRNNPGNPDTLDGGGKQPPEQVNVPAPARLVVTLPAGARLTIDGNLTQSSSAVRTFVTPPLQPGRIFSYTLTAEVVRNGQTLSATQKVDVRAGQESRATIQFSSEPVVRN